MIDGFVLGGSELMDPVAAMQELASAFSGDPDDLPDLRLRMLDDPCFALEIATHEAAHAFWGWRLGMPLRSVSILPPETEFDFAQAEPKRDKYLKILKHRISTSMDSLFWSMPSFPELMSMGDDRFFDWLGKVRPDYPEEMYKNTYRYKTICASPKMIPVHFPSVGTMRRIVWTEDNPLYRPPTALDLAIMSAMVPVMGPFYGKTWASIRNVDPDAEIASFTDWLRMDKPTDCHYLHSYHDNFRDRFLWHTSLKMTEDCGGGGDYKDMLFSEWLTPAPDTDEENLLVIESLSGMSLQDVVLATFLSPFNILHPNKAQIVFAIDGLAQALLESNRPIGGTEAVHILQKHAGLYKKMENSPKSEHTPSFLAARRWAELYEQHINRHLSLILSKQFKDAGRGFCQAITYFNDPQWTPVVAETAYAKYRHENWFTWTDKPFKSGRLTESFRVPPPL